METRTTRAQLMVYVGEEKNPIRLTDSAVEAVQTEASGRFAEAATELDAFFEDLRAPDMLDVEKLLWLRDTLVQAEDAVQILLDCRPPAEWDAEE
jgi:hypothetical protein